MIDKSIKADYAIQGGGPNYLGKQKMVKAPKKWQSSPDHEPAELAYITEKEKDILIDLDLYGSLNGKPNRGPSGIISLQGDLGGYGGSGGGGGRNGGGGGEGGGHHHRDPTPPPRVSPQQSIAMTGDTSLAGKTQSQAQASVDRDNARAAAEAIEDYDEAEAIRADLQKPIDDEARVREILTRGRGTEIPGERLFEDRISKYAVDEIDPVTGEYNAEAIQKAAKKESVARALGIGDPLTTEQITSLPTSTRIADFVPTQTRVENLQKAGSQFLPSFSMEGAKQYATNKLRNLAVKTGLGELGITGVLPQTFIPWGISKLFGGKKDPLKTVRRQIAKYKVPGTDTQEEATKKLVSGDTRDGDSIQTAITGEKGLLTGGAETLGLTEDQRKQYMLMQNKMKTALDQGSYTNQQGQVIQLNEQQLDQLQKYIDNLDNILGTVLQTAAYGGRIGSPLVGGSKYI
jgi:hypothetical protein